MTDAPGPGYRRRFLITPGPRSVTAALEDDVHAMSVRLDHDGHQITAVHPHTERAPWSVCPAAGAALVATFTGLPLDAATAPKAKWTNCTHLYDLAALGAAHARDPGPLTYDIAVADPENGISTCEIRANGALVHRWRVDYMTVIEPAELAGRELQALRDWIATLSPAQAEAARALQWSSMVAHGRQMADWGTFEAKDMPSNCFAFQPGRSREGIVRRVERHDFSRGGPAPLDNFDGTGFIARKAPPPIY